jgi:hypothetical protein
VTDAPQPAASSAAVPEAPPPQEESMTVGGILQRILNFESFSVLQATIALGRVIYILHRAVGRRGGGGSALRGDVGALSLRGCTTACCTGSGAGTCSGSTCPPTASAPVPSTIDAVNPRPGS